MPKYNNIFVAPKYVEHVFAQEKSGKKIGVLRVKPSGLHWKPVDHGKFFTISIADFNKLMRERKRATK